MKKTLATAALALTGLLAVPSQASADHEQRRGFHQSSHHRTFVSGRASCGCPIYSQRIYRGRDHCGNPIFHTVRVPFRCDGGCQSRGSARHGSDRWSRHAESSRWQRGGFHLRIGQDSFHYGRSGGQCRP